MFSPDLRTGSQAVALLVPVQSAGRIRDANGGRQYYQDCYIEGHVDFISGNAAAVFEAGLIHSKGAGFVTAQSKLAVTRVGTPTTGSVFRHCRLTGSDTGAGVFLGRPWRPYARVVYIECELGAYIRAESWDNWRNAEYEKTAWFAEYRSTGPGAKAAARVGWSKQSTDAQAAEFGTARFLKGDDGWNPEKAK